ncbi:UNVERIFIED_CONTAM: Mitochondrial adenine nucleotide transporter ADNT1 [Sesamum radiatum]|uniref:Mitochondrial adenine nucleotide transporter ADNT1 n=1 Tax=Sesamum radiatum TaxID=300843 RepID=A0AAW2JXQ1_SESRA
MLVLRSAKNNDDISCITMELVSVPNWGKKRPRSVLSSNIYILAVAYPLDLVRRRMQLEGAGGRARVYNTGLFGTFRHIIRSEGWRGLYRGILPEYYKVVPSVGIVFMTYEKLKQLLSSIPES